MKSFEEIEVRIKDALLERGFSTETVLNNRGLIGAIIEECESEFSNKLAGREYDEKLLEEWILFKHENGRVCAYDFLNHRYAKQDRISEIKEQIEKLSNELKELEK